MKGLNTSTNRIPMGPQPQFSSRYPNGWDLAFLDHYKRYILEGLKKGVLKQKQLNMIQDLQKNPTKTNEDPSAFLERIHQTYRKHTDADPQAPENVWMVNIIIIIGKHYFYWAKCPR